MRISDVTMEKLLVRSGVATEEQINALKQEAVRSNHPLQDISVQNAIIDDKTLTKAFSEYAKIPYVELDAHDIPPDILKKIPERIARQYNAILFKVDEDGTNHLAMDDPDDVQAVNFIEKEIGANTKIYIAPHNNIIASLDAYRDDVAQELEEVIDIQRADNTENEHVAEQDIDENSPIAKTINLLLESAIRSHASDVHIEPREAFVQIRYRIDGVLK